MSCSFAGEVRVGRGPCLRSGRIPIDWSVNQSESYRIDADLGRNARGAVYALCVVLASLDSGTVLIVVAVCVVPIALFIFARGAPSALKELGKGPFAIDQDLPAKGMAPPPPVTREVREAEIRQMLEARAYRAETRGQPPVDVDAELEKILASEQPGAGSLANDAELRQEVHDLVIARNERRARAGKQPLDVEEEVDRQLRELENMGQ